MTPRPRPSLLTLPGDIQLRILRHATSEKALPLIPYLSRSCRGLHAATRHEPTLYVNIDLSYGWCRPSDAIVTREAPRWSNATSVSIEGCATLSDAAVISIAKHCPRLRSIHLGGTKNISAEACRGQSNISNDAIPTGN